MELRAHGSEISSDSVIHYFTFSLSDEENKNQSWAMSELFVVVRGEEPLVGSYELVIIFICLMRKLLHELNANFQLAKFRIQKMFLFARIC